MHKLEVYVIDFENSGLDDVRVSLEQNRYFSVNVMSADTADIGEWDDDHVLNKTSTGIETYRSYFEK